MTLTELRTAMVSSILFVDISGDTVLQKTVASSTTGRLYIIEKLSSLILQEWACQAKLTDSLEALTRKSKPVANGRRTLRCAGVALSSLLDFGNDLS